jgi:hypothetical protein
MPVKRTAGVIIDPVSVAVSGWFEQRGDKRIEILNEDNGSPERLRREESIIVDGARRELQAASYPTDIEIVDGADRDGVDASTALMEATDFIAKAEGHTSHLWLAMRYLAQRSLLPLRVVNALDEGNEAMARAALDAGVVFAFAFLDWHEAFHGTDDAAYHGRRIPERLAKGRAKRSKRARTAKDERQKIVLQEYGDDITVGNLKCSVIAKDKMRLDRLNYDLEKARAKPFYKLGKGNGRKPILKDGKPVASRGALGRYLQRIRREQKQS